MTVRRRLAELQVAVMLLTRLPAGRLGDPAPSIAAAAWAFPLCGAIIGLASWGIYAVAAACDLPASLCALLAVAAAIALTGGLHEDGLADLADGLGGGEDRARRLEIMRDSRIGSYGVLALILAVGARVVSVAELGATLPLLAGFVATGAASRCGALLALALMPPARADGLGHAAGRPDRQRLLAGGALTVLLLAPLGPGAVGLAVAMALAAAVPAALARRLIGGQSGDVLGAVQSVSETAGWVALVALAP